MDIEAPSLSTVGGSFVASSRFSLAGEHKTIWFSAPERYVDGFMSDRLDAFLVALLPIAMHRGENIKLIGEVSERLLYKINAYAVPLLKEIDSRYKEISIDAESVTSEVIGVAESGGATGFSGGVDSFCTIADHFARTVPPSFGIGMLLFNNVGAVPSKSFHEEYEKLKGIEEMLGVKLIPVDSNLGALIDLPFPLTHTLRNVACALFLQGAYKKFYYASAYSYRDVRVERGVSIGSIDPILLNLLSTESLDVIADGSQHSRVEKTRIVSEFEPSKSMLNVCVAPHRIGNCSVCWKCGRTLFTLELLGKVEEYGSVFDLEKWSNARTWHIAEYILNPKKRADPFSREIRDLASEMGHKFSLKERLLGWLAAMAPQSVVGWLRAWKVS